MEEFIKSELEFEDDKLFWLVERLRDNFNSLQYNFAKTCECIYNICSYCKKNSFKAKNNEYYDANKLLAKFGFDKKAISRYKHSYERFVHNESCSLYALYEDFTASKLFELLALSDETAKDLIVKKLIKPTMTVKQIREYIKTVKDGINKGEKVIEQPTNKEINEDEIPMAYNPQQHYDFEYFEEKNKAQLLNIVWELQKEYEKLKTNFNKLKK